MSVQKVDIGSLSREVFGTVMRPFIDAFNIDDGGGIDCDLKVFGDEGSTSFLWYDHSEDKMFIQRTTTDTSPGRLLYIQALGSAMASGQNLQGMQIRSRATGTGTIAGGTDGAEIKAGLNSDSDTGTIAGARAVIANVDAKKGTITTGTCLEAQVDLGAGGTITTLYGVRASLNNSGTVTNGYAYHVDAVAGYPWTYGLYVKAGMATTGVYIGNCAGRPITIANTITGSTAQNCIEVGQTDATTMSSGYAHGIHVTATNSGLKSGGCANTQFNGVGVDFTLSAGGSAGFYALYAYMMKSGSPDCSSSAIAGVNVELTEFGATDYFAGVWINKYNTTKGSSIDAFLFMSNQGSGVTRAGLYFQGDKPDYLIQTANDATDNMLVKGAGTYTTAQGYFKVYLAANEYRIPIYDGVD
jgi:hypothetical protein